MSEPDDLYTLRAQFWMGHYQMAMDEAKSVMRRPMSPELKIEREEFMLRSQLALGQHDKVIAAAQESDAPGECLYVLFLQKQDQLVVFVVVAEYTRGMAGSTVLRRVGRSETWGGTSVRWKKKGRVKCAPVDMEFERRRIPEDPGTSYRYP